MRNLRVAEQLLLLTLNQEVPGLNPAREGISIQDYGASLYTAFHYHISS